MTCITTTGSASDRHSFMMRTLEDPSVVACQTMVYQYITSSERGRIHLILTIQPRGIKARVAAVGKVDSQRPAPCALLAGSAFVTGLIEAAFLVAIARIGLAVADGQSSVGLTRGVDISVNQALGVAGGLIFIRLLMALAAVRVQMGLTYRVTTRLRRDLAQAFLRSSWATQQSQPAGTLQQLVVTFPNHGANLLNALSCGHRRWAVAAGNAAGGVSGQSFSHLAGGRRVSDSLRCPAAPS
jgi:hypothetical protein